MKYLFFSLYLYTATLAAQSEAEYVDYIQEILGGKREVSVYGGRVDLLTDSVAYEVERAYKWKEAIGQCLWYAIQTNRKPGIILIVEDKKDYKYVVMLESTLDYAGIEVDVKVYPLDF